MCLYPTYLKNPKYKPNKKNKGRPPVCKDKRLLYIPTKCGCCIECRKEKQIEWRVRLEEEFRSNCGYFVTLTISTEGIADLEKKNRTEMGKKSKRNSYKRVEIVFRTVSERYYQECKTLVCNRIRRDGGPNTSAWYLFRTKKCRTNKKALAIRIFIYRPIL